MIEKHYPVWLTKEQLEQTKGCLVVFVEPLKKRAEKIKIPRFKREALDALKKVENIIEIFNNVKTEDNNNG